MSIHVITMNENQNDNMLFKLTIHSFATVLTMLMIQDILNRASERAERRAEKSDERRSQKIG